MEKYIKIEEFQDKVARHEWFCGYVIGAGYAYYVPLVVKPAKFIGSVLLDGEFTVIWVQRLDTSPEMRMKSLKEDPTKWTDFLGSTKLQRFAADEFAKKCDGIIQNKNGSDIYVEYKVCIANTQITKKQYFRDDGTLIPQEGEIKPLKKRSFAYFEMWLDSQSESGMEAVQKILCSIGYSIPNSIHMLLTGRTFAGRSVNSNEKVAAFIDVAPGLILWAMKATGAISKVGKGIEGYNRYLQKNPYLKGNNGLPDGMTWQQNAGRSFQTNQQNLIMNKHASDFLNHIGTGNTIYERYKRESE